MRYKVSKIVWDTDGERVKLPKKAEIEILDEDLEDVEDVNDMSEVDDLIADALSDTYGWCVVSFEAKPAKKTSRKEKEN